MYTENPAKDAVLFCKALMSNQLAKAFPKWYFGITHRTGRGEKEEAASQIAEYFMKCFHDYRDRLGMSMGEFKEHLRNKAVLEFGPGDIPGVAFLLYAYGAETVQCVDRFPLSKLNRKNIDVYQHLLESLRGEDRRRGESAFVEKANPRSGLDPRVISYKVTKDGLSRAVDAFDLILSRAVLEHVNDLEQTMLDIKRSMKKNGTSLHKVDLRSHGLDRYTDYDFLTWPQHLYKMMYSHKGVPNRWRADKYRCLAQRAGLRIIKLEPTGAFDPKTLSPIHAKVAKKFRDVSIHELVWRGFWIHLEHDSRP
ncbi:MAG: methyltransferase domain-containing protein [Chitinivibrionales bacterium]|nr:methyltransferase domain-containing protein [Chitinivibrionales bacterium]MBD3355838.1 methyltransferase domain-containing protein [Chitinivibrionales bacterium]